MTLTIIFTFLILGLIIRCTITDQMNEAWKARKTVDAEIKHYGGWK